jgi:hypothetical protein
MAVVGLDFHPPAEFGVVRLRVDKPRVCIVGAFDVLGVDDVALRIRYAICGH